MNQVPPITVTGAKRVLLFIVHLPQRLLANYWYTTIICIIDVWQESGRKPRKDGRKWFAPLD